MPGSFHRRIPDVPIRQSQLRKLAPSYTNVASVLVYDAVAPRPLAHVYDLRIDITNDEVLMPTLLIHEWIEDSGGAEKVLDAMVEAFPDCP